MSAKDIEPRPSRPELAKPSHEPCARIVDGGRLTRMQSLMRLLLVGFTAACVPSVQTIAYAPQPARITHPEDTLKALILANTVQGCVTDPIYSDAMLVVKFVCNNGAGNVVLRFDQIGSIELQQQGPWYRVRVHHSRGAEDFVWDSKSLEDAQRIDDAITAITAHGTNAPGQTNAPAQTTI